MSKNLALLLLLLGLCCLLLAGCQYWYKDMKGYLKYWSATLEVGEVQVQVEPESQVDSSGRTTISTNAAVVVSAVVENPDGHALNPGVGPASDILKSVRISGPAGSAALSRASVVVVGLTGIEMQLAPLFSVPTPESLRVEHKDFSVLLAPVRTETNMSPSEPKTLTFRYNTPPRMPLAVVESGGTFKWPGPGDSWNATGPLYYAWPQDKAKSGGGNPTDPDYAARFYIEDDGAGKWYPEPDCLEAGQTLAGSDGTVYNIYKYQPTGTNVTVYAEDGEGVRGAGIASGALIAITLDADGGTFGSGGGSSVTVYRAANSSLTGSDLDVPTKSGHYLSGWTANGTPVTFPYTVSGPATFTAQWTVAASSGGGSGGSGGGSTPVVPPAGPPNTFPVNPGDDLQDVLNEILAKNDGSSTYTLLLKGDFSGAVLDISPSSPLKLKISSGTGSPSTIDASGQDSVLKVGKQADVTLENIILTGGKTSSSGSGGGAYVEGKLTLEAGTSIKANEATEGGGVYVKDAGELVMNGGEIAGNTAANGGGVYVALNATFTATGGTIGGSGSPNHGSSNGGGIFIGSAGICNLDGVTISHNTAGTSGGGVLNNGRLTITSGQISNNVADYNGGGISNNTTTSTITMSGGSISGNVAKNQGNGIHQKGTFEMGGAATVAADNDVYLQPGTSTVTQPGTITVTSQLTGSSPVATITPSSYTAGEQVLAAGQGVTLTNEVGKFAVVPDSTGSGSYVVAVDSSDPTSGVLTNGAFTTGTEAVSQIASLSGNCTLRISGTLTADQIADITKAIDDNINITVSLDLSGVALPSNAIPQDSFKDCSNLVGITLPDSVTEISEAAFYGCTGLTSIVIPDSVRTIGDTAFMYCGKLALVRMEATTPPELGSSVFEQNAGLQIQVPAGSLSDYQVAPTWQDYLTYLVEY